MFDAYTPADKQKWITKIAQFTSSASNGCRLPANGHIPSSVSLGTLSNSHNSSQASASRNNASNGGSGNRAVHLPRSRSQTPTHRATSPLIDNLRSSPVHYPRQTSSSSSSLHAQDEPPVINVTAVTVSPSVAHHETGAGTKRRGQRHGQAQSMYLAGEGAANSMPLHPSPPFNRRGRQPWSVNQSRERPSNLAGVHRRVSQPAMAQAPRDLMTSPTEIPFPGSLECSQSSSSSALHPVSLAAIHSSTSNNDILEDEDQDTASMAVSAPPTIPAHAPHRKTSAPSVMHHSSQVGDQSSSSHFSSSEALGRVGSEERLDFIPLAVSTETSSAGGHSRQRSYDSSLSHNTEGVPTSPLATNCYRIDVGSIEHIHTATSGHSSTFSSAGNIHEVTRDTVISPPSPPTSESLQLMETSNQASSNPLYIETNGREEIAVPTHTQHPYEYWATSPTDVENLRSLSRYPWFHGRSLKVNR